MHHQQPLNVDGLANDASSSPTSVSPPSLKANRSLSSEAQLAGEMRSSSSRSSDTSRVAASDCGGEASRLSDRLAQKAFCMALCKSVDGCISTSH